MTQGQGLEGTYMKTLKNTLERKKTSLNISIPRNVKLAEAPSHGKPGVLYDEECKGSTAYMELAEEIINMEAAK